MASWLNNICLLTDSYKISHYKLYPPGTEKVYSYFESRSGSKFPKTVFFGLNYLMKEYLAGNRVTQEMIGEADDLLRIHFGQAIFNRKGWESILYKHHGKLPIEIKAVKEGSIVPESNPLFTIENTDPDAFWLTNYLESLLVQLWYPCTVASQSLFMKKIILDYLQSTGDPQQIDFKLHDFGFRGVTCPEQAALGAAAHLLHFKGTDTIPGILLTSKYYGESMAGFSIPATEHSTITSWGETHELDAMRNLLDQYPHGMIACVSDSFDIYRACREYWGTKLKDKILQRDGILIVRPDSGEPTKILLEVLKILGEAFGTEVNAKGYRVLHPKIRLIQGDGIDFKMLGVILQTMKEHYWSADNIAFGSGGGLLQKMNRDTQKFALKCSSITIDGKNRDVFKRPITDLNKQSKAGRLKLCLDSSGHWKTQHQEEMGEDQLQTVFLNGDIVFEQTFQEIRDYILKSNFLESSP